MSPTDEQKEESIMATMMTEGQRVLLTAEFKTAKGNTAAIQNPVWSPSDNTVMTLAEVTEQERTDRNIALDAEARWAVAVGPVGTAQVQLVVDADLGDGVREITGLHDIEVKAAEATQVLIAAGAPEDQPTA